MPHSSLPAVLITGCSSGIGASCAQHLAQKGFQVYAGVRGPEAQAQWAHHRQITAVQLDVTRPEDWRAVAAQMAAAHPQTGLAGLVNNAGVGMGGPIALLPVDRFRAQFEVNFFGVIEGIQVCLPLLRQGSPGRIVNISSVNGRVSTPFLAPYCSSKFALEGLNTSLRHELAGWGIACSIVEPGMIQTPIFGKSLVQLQDLRRELGEEAAEYADVFALFERVLGKATQRGTAPEAVAVAVEKALTARQPRLRYVVGKDAHIALALHRLLPETAFDGLLTRLGMGRRQVSASVPTPADSPTSPTYRADSAAD
ncbi:MAG: SDR family oxidoreductase [Candidatus Sericytochromatia bacterium]